jgi:AhpD family alkylhydroperoxidase
MSKDWKAIANDVNQRSGALYQASPDAVKGFGQITAATMKDGALDKKTKELMAAAISVVIRCEGCIAYHTQAAIKAGATREEFTEALNVAIEMGGGPSVVYAGQALDAYGQLAS